MQYDVVNILELPFMRAEVGDDAIIRIYFLKDVSVTLQNLKDLFDLFAANLNPHTYYCLIFTTEENGNASIRGSMDSSLLEHSDKINRLCVAVVVKNLTQRMVANFVIRFSKVKTPTKLVATLEDAEAYCHEMKEKQL